MALYRVRWFERHERHLTASSPTEVLNVMWAEFEEEHGEVSQVEVEYIAGDLEEDEDD